LLIPMRSSQLLFFGIFALAAPLARSEVIAWEVVTDVWVHDVPGPPQGDFWDSVTGNLFSMLGNAGAIYPDIELCARPVRGGTPQCIDVCWDVQGDTKMGRRLASEECQRPLRVTLPPNDSRLQITVVEVDRSGSGAQVHGVIAKNIVIDDPAKCRHDRPCEFGSAKGTLSLSFGTELQGTAGDLPTQPPAVAASNQSRCVPPSRQWSSDELNSKSGGLHGPYASLSDVMRQDPAGGLALRLTGSGTSEYGYLILRDQRQPKGGYYTTPPVRSSQDPTSVSKPMISGNDYLASWKRAFENSCENIDQFVLAATVHTHPDPRLSWTASNSFSADDFNQSISEKQRGAVFEKIFMINAADRKVRAFEPQATDALFSDWEKGTASLVPQLVPKWHTYANRVQIIGSYP
jgi:hypothetical protein